MLVALSNVASLGHALLWKEREKFGSHIRNKLKAGLSVTCVTAC